MDTAWHTTQARWSILMRSRRDSTWTKFSGNSKASKQRYVIGGLHALRSLLRSKGWAKKANLQKKTSPLDSAEMVISL